MEKSSIRRMLNITDIMMKYLRARKSSVPFEDVVKSVSEGLTIWLNVTSEENKISSVSQKTFQSFFIVLYELINHCRNSPVDDEFEFAKMASYRGFAYRYICAAHNDDLAPDVAYNNTFVSWNRAPYSASLESSFAVRVTWVKCEIVAPTFGINLEGISRWLRQLFLTLMECTTLSARGSVWKTRVFLQCKRGANYADSIQMLFLLKDIRLV